MNDKTPWRSAAPFAGHLGVVFEPSEAGHSKGSLELRDELTNRKGDAHGGVVMALLDIASSEAVRASRNDLGGLSTLSIAVNFLAPGRGTLIARGRVVRSGRSVAFTTAEVTDAEGVLVATAQVTLKLFALNSGSVGAGRAATVDQQ